MQRGEKPDLGKEWLKEHSKKCSDIFGEDVSERMLEVWMCGEWLSERLAEESGISDSVKSLIQFSLGQICSDLSRRGFDPAVFWYEADRIADMAIKEGKMHPPGGALGSCLVHNRALPKIRIEDLSEDRIRIMTTRLGIVSVEEEGE